MKGMKYYSKYLVFWCLYCNVFSKATLIHQKEKPKKSDRFGYETSWWNPEPWMSDHKVPVLIGPPLQKPNFERSRGKIEPIRPPAPLEHIHPPAPLVQSTSSTPIIRQQKIENEHLTRVHAEDIRCTRSNGITLFTARIIPPHDFTSLPVFENADNSYSSSDCDMRSTFDQRTFDMHVQHFSKCGVRIQQDAEGKEWMSVTLRFPFVKGLRMAEDEYVMIMCRPQERIAFAHHIMDMRGRSSEADLRKVFSISRDVSCKVSLMTTTQGTKSFSREIKTGQVLNLGQDLQIRAIVREGSGWKYAMLKEVVVSCPRDEAQSSYFNDFGSNEDGENAVYSDKRSAHSSVTNSALLVFNNGCRNPIYKAIAPHHPQRNSSHPLMVTFTFKAFMFQNMVDGDVLRLSIKVIACADLSDCQPRFCERDFPKISEERKRRESVNRKINQMKDFAENFELNVALGGFSKLPLTSHAEEFEEQTSEGNCKFLLLTVLSVAILFFICLTGAVAIIVGNLRRKASTGYEK